MRRLAPASTAGQLALIVVLATVIAHLISSAVWIRLREQAPPEVRGAAERIALFTRACLVLSDTDCARAAAAAGGPGLRIALTDDPPAGPALPDAEAGTIARALMPADPRSAGTATSFTVGVPAHGRWLSFEVEPRLLHGRRAGPVFMLALMVLLTVVPLLALSLWAVRQVTQPLVRLARITEAIGADDPLNSIPEAGTREIRMLARAFNGLLDRLRRFVMERTRVLAAVSHDLRTPLTRIRLRAEAIEDEALRGRLLRDVRMMELMIGASLSLLEAQEKREPIEVVDVAALLATICDEFADAGFEVTYAGPLHCAARCQPRALERAMNNIIDNANKFGGGASVTLRLAAQALEIDVEDDGPGIPAEERENVVKPFYRMSEARSAETPGSGLGLAIAHTLVEGQGGGLALRDRAPRGLCVRITLPRI